MKHLYFAAAAALLAACTSTEPPPPQNSADAIMAAMGLKRVEMAVTSLDDLPREIYTEEEIGLIRDLTGDDPDRAAAAITAIKAAPASHRPYLFYMMSGALIEAGEMDEAAFWFYAGQLRSRYDSNRCGDTFATGLPVQTLNDEYGVPVNQYMFKDADKLERIVADVTAFEQATAHDYDPRWVFFVPLEGAFVAKDPDITPNTARCLPKSKWPAIHKTTISNHLKGSAMMVSAARDQDRLE